jgi:hypothetical protein
LQSGWQFGSAEGEHANRGQGRGDLIVAATREQTLFAEHIARSQVVDDRLAPVRQPHATRTQEIQGERTVVEIEQFRPSGKSYQNGAAAFSARLGE